MVTDVGEAARGPDNEVAGLLDPKVAQILLRGHVEAGFELSQEAAEGKVGRVGKGADGDVIAVVLVEQFEGGPKFLVLA